MNNYLLKRIILLPLTLFAIILINFVILNMAPNEPTTLIQKSATGEAQRGSDDMSKQDHQYLQFREHFGLTLPILINLWPMTKAKEVDLILHTLAFKQEEMAIDRHHKLRSHMGDKARFIMPLLLQIVTNKKASFLLRKEAVMLFIRGGTKQGLVKPSLTADEKLYNRLIANSNDFLQKQQILKTDDLPDMEIKANALENWFLEQGDEYIFTPQKKLSLFFFETRLFRYLSRVITLDFGHIREDRNKTVISEVAKRMKFSLTLALLPMLITFFLSVFFGMVMALYQHRTLDIGLNLLFLFLFAIPIFVMAPFLIEKIALHRTFPFTEIPIPYSGFSSSHELYQNFTSLGRLQDIMLHLFLPLIAIIYGSLAIQSRLARTAFLEVMRQDFVRFAKAKGVPRKDLWIRHIGRAGSITLITSAAASLGVVLGGSLIVETIFEINGFGRFFYEAIVQRDYNVVLFSAIAGSFLTLIGYLLADLSYTLLDPRITLD